MTHNPTPEFPPLQYGDMAFVVRRLPKDVRKLLSDNPGRLFLGGGFIRALIAGETPNDIDLFGESKDFLIGLARSLEASRGAETTRLHITKNAVTVISQGRLTIQFITRWVFDNPKDCVASFDFTVCQAAVWRKGASLGDPWQSARAPRFYEDLAARRLVYTSPRRDEEAGGSLLRVIKYIRRGYVIQTDSLASVIARLTAKLDTQRLPVSDEPSISMVLNGFLQEVDPLMAVDGLEVTDDGETTVDGLDNGPTAERAPEAPLCLNS